VPLLALYEGSIIAVRIVEKNATARQSSTGATPPATTNPAE
jgi:sec-independent protein translocase protein TatC